MLLLLNSAVWLLMFTVPCYMEAYFCTLRTRRVRMENSGMPMLTVSFMVSPADYPNAFLSLEIWNFSVLYEMFPVSFLMEQAGGQSFTGKQRVG